MNNKGTFGRPEEVATVANEGERYVPLVYAYNAAMHLGHMAAYKAALRYTYGKHVLDLGCGTGYGSHFLASFGAASVVAADVDQSALDYAKTNYAHANIRHMKVNANDPLPFDDGTFDFVFCSQVIEHIAKPVTLMKEIRRVLKKGSFCLITAPNKELFTPDPAHADNDYHVSEMTLKEYETTGREAFPKMQVAGIPQNCLVFHPGKPVSVKPNEAIHPDDYRMRTHELAACENLLLFGHTDASGSFAETLPASLAKAADSLAPLFLDASEPANQWVALGLYPKNRKLGDSVSNSSGSVQTSFESPYDRLYRIDTGLTRAGDFAIEATLRSESKDGEIVFQGPAAVENGIIRFLFPPVEAAQGKRFCLELNSNSRLVARIFKSRVLPRFSFVNGQLPLWTFHYLSL